MVEQKDFGKDELGREQVFNLPSEKELLAYLKIHLERLERNPNDCSHVSLRLPAMHVYALQQYVREGRVRLTKPTIAQRVRTETKELFAD